MNQSPSVPSPITLTGANTAELLRKVLAFEVPRLDELERTAFEVAYERNNRNVSRTGRVLGISRTGVYRRLKSYGLLT